jgi:hypothetical protein
VLRALGRPKVLRTCRSCAFAWKVPRYYALPQSERVLDAKSRSHLAGRRGREAVARRLREFVGVRSAYGHCPRCDEEAFSQRRLWVQSNETYLGVERY